MGSREKAPALPRGGDYGVGIGGYFNRKSERVKRRTQRKRDVVHYDIIACLQGFKFNGHKISFNVRVSEKVPLLQYFRPKSVDFTAKIQRRHKGRRSAGDDAL